MAQDYIKINNIQIRQPDEGLGYDFETTYSEDTTRVQSGVLNLTPQFTAEAFSYSAKNLTVSEMRTILQQIAKGGKFSFHYFSPYYGQWRTDYFYVGKGSISIGKLDANKELFSGLSFSVIGVNPL
ncbi:MAG: hypothetical protein KBS74_03710 [Clostridiales bacterium]|nr:hypothetical protein [Candidatus Cacconaster stercorequi]